LTLIKRKLIEVSLPLEAINAESSREKSIRHGHPSTLHLWWARRPLAACRAILFAQLVDDPSSNPEEFPTIELQAKERSRLFAIIEKLVIWENAQDEGLLEEALTEILKSHGGKLPKILDPFAGGGSIPLEAQRLGLDSYASDLNPVAVLINKAMIEIPARWRDRLPVYPDSSSGRMSWDKASGLAQDVRQYGELVRKRVEDAVGPHYPKVSSNETSELNVLAWIWARTVKCPNPSCGIKMPLVRSWWVCKRDKKQTWIQPIANSGLVEYRLVRGKGGPINDGTITRSGGICFACGANASLTYIREEGVAGRIDEELLCTVGDSSAGRMYFEADAIQKSAAILERPSSDEVDLILSTGSYMGAPRYGMTTTAELFPNRQLNTCLTFTREIQNVRADIERDALAAGLEKHVAEEYSGAVITYLVFAFDKGLNLWSSLASWMPDREALRETFVRQALPIVWDFAEPNPLGDVGGSWKMCLDKVCKAIEALPANSIGSVSQKDARNADYSNMVVSTDPPYYDNVPYADLSDYFYAWMRPALKSVYPNLFGTVATPKSEELVADQMRQGGQDAASKYFEDGFKDVFKNIVEKTEADSVLTVYYAFKQTDSVSDDGTSVSTGWETILSALIDSGLAITATWPVKTEGAGRIRSIGSNALASSIVLACRRRATNAEVLTRRNFVSTLKSQLPSSLLELQQGSIAPVDLAQAAIGPGMAIFSAYSKVVEVDGSDMTVKTALAIINQVLDEVLNDQENDFDSETRFCVRWFSQYGWSEAPFGEAESLAKAVNTSIFILEKGGIFKATAGKARLLAPSEMSETWDPAYDKTISIWEVAIRLGNSLKESGIDQAARWAKQASSRVELDAVKELSYLLYSIAEKKGLNDSAIMFNMLGSTWSDLRSSSSNLTTLISEQQTLDI